MSGRMDVQPLGLRLVPRRDTIVKNETEKLFTAVRELARQEYKFLQFPFEDAFRAVDEFIASAVSECQKAMYLLLNLSPRVEPDYIIVPAENVLIRNVYNGSDPEYEYGIDIAVYGGHQDHPVKLAILCDELPFNVRDRAIEPRRRDVNLQAAGWLVPRFQSFEIIEELKRSRGRPTQFEARGDGRLDDGKANAPHSSGLLIEHRAVQEVYRMGTEAAQTVLNLIWHNRIATVPCRRFGWIPFKMCSSDMHARMIRWVVMSHTTDPRIPTKCS